ncbi:MAG: hypothetical protein IPH52_18015 [Leptospiraceae bacterium]|nr:hypothetical protein [Leptospiraceae bacterium]
MYTINYINIKGQETVFTESVEQLPVLNTDMKVIFEKDVYLVKSIGYYPGKSKYRIVIEKLGL